MELLRKFLLTVARSFGISSREKASGGPASWRDKAQGAPAATPPDSKKPE